MQTFKRICIKDWEITAENGDHFEVKRGKEYLTSAVNQAPAIGPEAEEGHVIVFSSFWVPVPVIVFAGEVQFTGPTTKLTHAAHMTPELLTEMRWPRWVQRMVRRWTFGTLPPDADGWYVWRNSPAWPKHEYKCIEIANGVMVDTEPTDSYGTEWRVVECKPYGQFRGPILPR